MENKIIVQNPCNKNWNSMSPNKNGRFCNSCTKTVVDFRKMNPIEIHNYFNENSNEETICGHFKTHQIETNKSIKYENLKKQLNRIKIKPIKIFALFSLSLVFSLSSCIGVSRRPLLKNYDVTNDNEINNNVESVENQKDSIKSKGLN